MFSWSLRFDWLEVLKNLFLPNALSMGTVSKWNMQIACSCITWKYRTRYVFTFRVFDNMSERTWEYFCTFPQLRPSHTYTCPQTVVGAHCAIHNGTAAQWEGSSTASTDTTIFVVWHNRKTLGFVNIECCFWSQVAHVMVLLDLTGALCGTLENILACLATVFFPFLGNSTEIVIRLQSNGGHV